LLALIDGRDDVGVLNFAINAVVAIDSRAAMPRNHRDRVVGEQRFHGAWILLAGFARMRRRRRLVSLCDLRH
jgi:hypothetical protein